MTLHITLTSSEYVLQVSDRLLSKLGSDARPSVHDDLGNKNLLFHARDAIATIGYTGAAYLRGLSTYERIPTDEWIARKITGIESTIPAREGKGTFGSPVLGRPLPVHRDIGQTVALLRNDVRSTFQRAGSQAGRLGLVVLISGYQWSEATGPERGVRPFVWTIGRKPGTKTFDAGRAPRHWSDPFKLNAIGTRMTDSELSRLGEALSASFPKPDDSERIMVAAIREVADRTGVVGKHCSSVLIIPDRHLRVRFLPFGGEILQRSPPPASGQVVPVAVTPWVIGHDTIVPPQEVSGGGMTIWFGRTAVEVEAPVLSPGSGVIWSLNTQPRPPAPSRRRG